MDDLNNYRIQKFGPIAATPITMAVIFPGTLNLRSSGRWLTAYLQPPLGFYANAIEVGSILLQENEGGAEPVPVDAEAPSAVGDQNGDDIPDLMVKFDRVAVELTLPEGESILVKVTGTMTGIPFSGTTILRTLRVTNPN